MSSSYHLEKESFSGSHKGKEAKEKQLEVGYSWAAKEDCGCRMGELSLGG